MARKSKRKKEIIDGMAEALAGKAVRRALQPKGTSTWFVVTLRMEYPADTKHEAIEDEVIGILDDTKRHGEGAWTDLHCDGVQDE